MTEHEKQRIERATFGLLIAITIAASAVLGALGWPQ